MLTSKAWIKAILKKILAIPFLKIVAGRAAEVLQKILRLTTKFKI
jgi:hypothetical protein